MRSQCTSPLQRISLLVSAAPPRHMRMILLRLFLFWLADFIQRCDNCRPRHTERIQCSAHSQAGSNLLQNGDLWKPINEFLEVSVLAANLTIKAYILNDL